MQDNEGNTALMYACFMGNTEVVKTLADAHIKKQVVLNFEATNSDGLTALLYARDCMHSDIIQILISCMSEDKSECVVCYQEDKDAKLQRKPKSRIDGLAVSLVDQEPSASSETAGNISENEDDTNTTSGSCSQNISKIKRESMTSTVIADIAHVPEAKEDYVKTLLDIAENSKNENKNTLELNALFVADSANAPYRNEPVSKKLKKSKRKASNTKGKMKKRKSENHTETADKKMTVSNKTADAFGAIKPAYSSETENKTTEVEEDDVTLIRRIVMDNAKRELYTTLNIERDRPFVELDTGKIDCLNLEPDEKAKVLGRTVWSVYGAPLPPIPVDDNAVKRVVDEISDVRKYLGKASCQEGRLVNLDPELWCILESMRPDE